MKQFLLNGKIIQTADVLGRKFPESKQTQFEDHLFKFIRTWYSDQNKFTIKTSGSTGKPTIVTVTKDQMIASAEATIKAFDLKAGDKILLCLDPAYIAGMMMVVRAVIGQLNLIAVEPSENPFETHPQEDQPDFAAMVPYQLKGILKGPEQSRNMLRQLQHLLLGGGPVDEALEDEIKKLETPVYLGFGMSETVSHIALRRLNGLEASKAYRCLPDIKVKTDSRDCLCIKGAVTGHNWITTNDQVEIRNGNIFIWKGRIDHVINSGGIKIHPEEVEKQIATYFKEKRMVSNFFIAGLPDAITGQKLCLIVEGRTQVQDWIPELKKRLPLYKNPKEVIFIKHFIYTKTGKIQREKTLEVLSFRS
jgi:O-succinylbenzoic acid--CoA ligase